MTKGRIELRRRFASELTSSVFMMYGGYGEMVFALAQHYELGIERKGLACKVDTNIKVAIKHSKQSDMPFNVVEPSFGDMISHTT
jgi:hypothetical protein